MFQSSLNLTPYYTVQVHAVKLLCISRVSGELGLNQNFTMYNVELTLGWLHRRQSDNSRDGFMAINSNRRGKQDSGYSETVRLRSNRPPTTCLAIKQN